MKYFITLSYDGSFYHGWQVQPNANTIQSEVNEALRKILGNENGCAGSGRTDTGVHALGQVCHFESEKPLDVDKLKYKLNAVLPNDIAVVTIREVRQEAHARFDATSRTYHYYLHNAKNPFRHKWSYYFKERLNLQLMNEACETLMDYTDFESFSKVHTEVKTFNCEIIEAKWKIANDQMVFTITANRFLRNMVRAVVGTMIEIGLGKISHEDFRLIIESKNRSRAGRSVPAEGLYLSEVNYPMDIYVN